jgi:hypothetical protein
MNKMIFLGNGDHSAVQAYELHRDLERALSILSGLQQAPFASGPDVAEDWDELERIAKKLYESLTGDEVTYA